MNTMSGRGRLLVAIAIGLIGTTLARGDTNWLNRVKVSTDARVRLQITDEEGKESRQRWRFRGRLGLEGKVNDQVKANIRLVTNAGDPISDNQTMDNAFDDKNASFDRVFFTYTPFDPLSIRAGKMSQPWIAVDDLVFSADVNPEGVAANVKLESDVANLMLHGGAFVIDERSSDDETMMISGQAAAKFALGKKEYIVIGASLFAFSNVEGYGLQGPDDTKSWGNSTVKVADDEGETTLLYATEYAVVEGFLQAALDVGLPLKLGAQYIVNTDADDADTGYLFSASLKLSKVVTLGYQYRYLEKDCTLGVFAESTDFGNGTNVKGHIPYLKYQISKNFDAKVQYAMGQKGVDDGKDVEVFKFDVACSF